MQTGSKLFQWQKYNDQNWTDPYARHMHSLQLSQVKQHEEAWINYPREANYLLLISHIFHDDRSGVSKVKHF